VIATTLGVLAGWGLLHWLVTSLVGDTFPDLGIDVAIATGTLVTAFALGVIAVAAAPLLTIRKLTRMDLPATLRVVE
jgi:putative ABC transport system permease protein